MDLNSFIQKKENNSDKKFEEKIIFENSHIRVLEKEFNFEVECFDKKGLLAMHECFQLSLAKGKKIYSVEELEEFYQESVQDKQEGIMIKVLDKEYKAGKKIGYMYKMKPTSEDVDVVIIGAEKGKGKRGGFFSSFHVAILDGGEFKTIGKVGSGFTENEEDELSIQQMTQLLTPLITQEDEKKGITYFKPEIIIQVSFQDLQESQTTQSKYALRFPKIVALRNSDKTLDDVTTLDEVLHHN